MRKEGGRLLVCPDPRPRGGRDNGPFVSSCRLDAWVPPRLVFRSLLDQVFLVRPCPVPAGILLTLNPHPAQPRELGGSAELGHIYSSLALLSELLNIEAKLFGGLGLGQSGGGGTARVPPWHGSPRIAGASHFLGLRGPGVRKQQARWNGDTARPGGRALGDERGARDREALEQRF